MKKILFICSHPYSGSSALYEALDHYPKIQGFKSNNSYYDPRQLIDLTHQQHKLINRSAIYMDELLYNRSFYVSAAYKKCQFIYVIREPEIPLYFMISGEKKNPTFAIRQYTFRLRRLCEMAKRTPGAVLLTWRNLSDGKGLSLIQDYLNLKEPISYDPILLAPFNRTFTNNLIDSKLLASAQDAYERYLYFMKNQKLAFI